MKFFKNKQLNIESYSAFSIKSKNKHHLSPFICTASVDFGVDGLEFYVVLDHNVGHENGMSWITIIRKQNRITERFADSRTWFGIHNA